MIGDAPYPKAAPAVFPLPGHGSLAEADAAEAAARALDYGSPFAKIDLSRAPSGMEALAAGWRSKAA